MLNPQGDHSRKCLRWVLDICMECAILIPENMPVQYCSWHSRRVKKAGRHLPRESLLVVVETQQSHFTPFFLKCVGCYSTGCHYSGLFWEWWIWMIACGGGIGRKHWYNIFFNRKTGMF